MTMFTKNCIYNAKTKDWKQSFSQCFSLDYRVIGDFSFKFVFLIFSKMNVFQIIRMA